MKLVLKLTHPFEKCRPRPISSYNVSAVRASKKSTLLSRIGSRPRAFQRAIDEVRTLPLTPQKEAQKAFFVSKIKVQPNKVYYKVSLCANFQRHSCSRTISLSNGV